MNARQRTAVGTFGHIQSAGCLGTREEVIAAHNKFVNGLVAGICKQQIKKCALSSFLKTIARCCFASVLCRTIAGLHGNGSAMVKHHLGQDKTSAGRKTLDTEALLTVWH